MLGFTYIAFRSGQDADFESGSTRSDRGVTNHVLFGMIYFSTSLPLSFLLSLVPIPAASVSESVWVSDSVSDSEFYSVSLSLAVSFLFSA